MAGSGDLGREGPSLSTDRTEILLVTYDHFFLRRLLACTTNGATACSPISNALPGVSRMHRAAAHHADALP